MSNGNNCIMVGIDLHDNSMLLALGINAGDPTYVSFETDSVGRQRMIEMLKAHAARHDATVHVVYEASGNGFLLYDELVQAGFTCHVLAPSKIPRSATCARRPTARTPCCC